MLSERSQSERLHTYNPNYMAFWKRQNYADSKKISSCQQSLGGRKDEGMENRGFLWQWTVLHDPTQRTNPNVNYRFQLIKMYCYWLINCNKCTILLQDINNRENWVWGWGRILKLFVLFAHSHKPKTKNSVLRKTKIKNCH